MTIGSRQQTGYQWTCPADHDHEKVPVIKYRDGTYGCGRPPRGWECTREPAHEGPCAAIQVVDTKPKHIAGCDTKEKLRDTVFLWQQEHDKKHIDPKKGYRYSGCIGGAYTWETTGTSLGQITVVRCTCGEAIDVTDYDW